MYSKEANTLKNTKREKSHSYTLSICNACSTWSKIERVIRRLLGLGYHNEHVSIG
jgi:hypothetical protein